MESAAPDLVEDIEVAMVVEEELRDTDTPESKLRRTIGGLGVSVSYNLVSVCAVYGGRVMVGAGRQFECDSMSRSEVYHRVRANGSCAVVLVAQEFATDVMYGTYASAPSLKVVKLGLILASADLVGIKAEQKLLSLHDVHVALCHARIDSDEPIPVVPPPKRGTGITGSWAKPLYGTRKTSMFFQRYALQVLRDEGLHWIGVACQV